jgi:hypothetical protein
MTTQTNSAERSREQVSFKRLQLEDICSQVQTARNLVMASARLCQVAIINTTDAQSCIEATEAVTQAAWSELETLLQMIHDFAGPTVTAK